MIIGVSGYTEDDLGNKGSVGAGKDTVADILVARHGFVKLALADEMKRICRNLWGFSENQLWGPSSERSKPGSTLQDSQDLTLTPRVALQQLGTEVARAIDPDVWVRFTIRTAKRILEGGHYDRLYGVGGCIRQEDSPPVNGVVISDVRFPNEVAAIQRNGGKVWRKKRQFSVLSSHASETALSDRPDSHFDVVLPDASLSHLKLVIDDIMTTYTGRIVAYEESEASKKTA